MHDLELVDVLLSTLIHTHPFIPMTWPTTTTHADDEDVVTWEGIGNIRTLTSRNANYIGRCLLSHLTGDEGQYTFQTRHPNRAVALAALERLDQRPATGELAAFLTVARFDLTDETAAA